MSAYGAITRAKQSDALPPLRLPAPSSDDPVTSHPPPPLIVYHLTLTTASPDLVTLLWKEFSDEVERGTTYPQEGPITREAFESYFFAGDVFVALSLLDGDALKGITPPITEVKGDRNWEECILGFYYVKPNYPGRSSHICNAGFVVRASARGKRVGFLLGQSYLFYAPKLGYKASVFNLVYANNAASLAIWDRLGFKRVGLIPGAGRLKRSAEEGGGEHYVDAVVIWKSFE